MDVKTLVEVLCAVHLASYVESPFEDRGGLMLVGPPGALKSTMVATLERPYNDAIMLSDINARTLNDLRDQIAQNTIRTLVLPEIQKIYERHPYTASNVEGTLRALAGEGFSSAGFQDARVARLRARACIIGALTPDTYDTHFKQWDSTGYTRRFLWALVYVKDITVLDRSLYEWTRLDFQIRHVPLAPVDGSRIPNLTTKQERQLVRGWVKYQPGGSPVVQAQLLAKVLAVLKWWYIQLANPRTVKQQRTAYGTASDQAINVLMDFVPALGKEGAPLDLPEPVIATDNNKVKARG